MLLESLFSAIAEAVFGYLLQSGLAEWARAVLGMDPQRRAFQTALAGAYNEFAQQYPEWTASLFDKAFLTSEPVIPLLAELLTRRGQPNSAELARLFAIHLGHSDPDRWERLGEAARAAADFLKWLDAELARQEEENLQRRYDRRAWERIADNTEAIRQQLAEILERVGQRKETPDDIRVLSRAVQERQIALVTDERAVDIGGSADGAVIVTGNNNVLFYLNAAQRRNLERLLISKHHVPSLPKHYLLRKSYLERLRRVLLQGCASPCVIGIWGMVGVGKSVLAKALAHDPEIQRAFPDGIFWLSLGSHPNIRARQVDLYAFVTGQHESFDDEIQGHGFLSSILSKKVCLVILDDVREARHAEAFPIYTTSQTCWLLTTQNADILRALNAESIHLGVLSEEEALYLLADWAGQAKDHLPPEARDIAKRCGYLPLALATIGAFVRYTTNGWKRALHHLQTSDFVRIRRLFPNYEHENLLAALDASLEGLSPEVYTRYLDLAIFPEETPIPLFILETFWVSFGLDEYKVADLVDTFTDRSLAFQDDNGNLYLSAIQSAYLVNKVGERILAMHQCFLQACAQTLLLEKLDLTMEDSLVEALLHYFDRARPDDDAHNAAISRADRERYAAPFLLLAPAVIVNALRNLVMMQTLALRNDVKADRELELLGVHLLWCYRSLIKAYGMGGVAMLVTSLPALSDEDVVAFIAYTLASLADDASPVIAFPLRSATFTLQDEFQKRYGTGCKIALAYALLRLGQTEPFRSFAPPYLAGSVTRKTIENLTTSRRPDEQRLLERYVVGAIILDVASEGRAIPPNMGWKRKQ
jgi:hypothetical protein